MSLHPSTDILADAIAKYAEVQNTTTLSRLLRAVYNLLLEGADIIIPVAAQAAEAGQIALVTHTTDNDNLVYVAAYTENVTLPDAKEFTTIERPLANYFEAILQMEGIAGIIFNPTSPTPFTMQKKMLSELLAQLQQGKAKNSIGVWRGDITTLDCDVIVNAANSSLLGGGGVDGAIHAAAGPELLRECSDLNGCKTGEAKITFGYDLKTPYVIHTVGPIYNGKTSQRLELADCYRNSLDLAKKHHLHSIAFSAISTGVYGYPVEEAARIALLTVTQWLNANPTYGMNIILTCFNSAVQNAYESVIEAAKKGELE